MASSGTKSALNPGRMRVARSQGDLEDLPVSPGVYRFVSRKSGKVLYVGQTNNLRRRAAEHKREGKLNLKLHKFAYGVAKSRRRDALCETEVAHIAKQKPRRNKTRGGNGKR